MPKYEANIQSLQQYVVPEWYKEREAGQIINYALYFFFALSTFIQVIFHIDQLANLTSDPYILIIGVL